MVLAGVRKDRNKDLFFKRNAPSRLPPTILERFNAASLSEKREFLNEVVTRNDSGSWMFSKDGQLFKEWQRDRSDAGLVTKTGKEAAHEWGGWGVLAECRSRGDVWAVKRKGRTCYQWREVAGGSDRGGNVIEAPCLLQSHSELDSATRINVALENWGCHLQLTEEEVRQWEGCLSRPIPKVFETLRSVDVASERAYRQAKDLYRRISDLAETDQLTKRIARQLKKDSEAPPT